MEFRPSRSLHRTELERILWNSVSYCLFPIFKWRDSVNKREKEEENRISRNCLNELNFGIENEKRTNCIQWILGTTPHRLYTTIVYACIWVDKYFHVNICDSLVLCVVLCIANFILSLFCLVIMQFRVLIESAICTCSPNSTEIKTKQKFDYVDKRWRTTNKWNGINWRGWNRIVN